MSGLLITHPFPDDLCDDARSAGIDIDAYHNDSPMPPAEILEGIAGKDGIVSMLNDTISAEVLSSPGLKVVSNCAVGYDNIDIEAATKLGVVVTNTPGVLTDATADLTMALMLATARRVPEGNDFIRNGKYKHWKLNQEQIGQDLSNQTLGIVGLGKIGQAVARRATDGFGMRILYAQPRRLEWEVESSIGATHVDFDSLISESDVISIHAPLTTETRHMFDKDVFNRMKKSAILINTSRGPLINEAELAAALLDGLIWGAGLDVFEHEPSVCPALLERTERLVLLPHIGSATLRTRRRMAELSLSNAIDVLEGRTPAHIVNRDLAVDTQQSTHQKESKVSGSRD